MSSMRWGDIEDEDYLPPKEVSGPDKQGIKTITEYFRDSKGDPIKRVRRIQVTNVQQKLYKAAVERKGWKRFGDAVNQVDQGITAVSVDDIPFERVRRTKEEKKPRDFKQVFATGNKQVISTSLHEKLQQRKLERLREQNQQQSQPSKEEPQKDQQPSKTSYVPPSRRGGATERKQEDNSVRVSNLSEEVDEKDLQDLFGFFGGVKRVYIAEDKGTRRSRGFGFVNFYKREDAQKAIDKLNGYGYANLILRVEWSAPRPEKQ